MSCRAVVLEIHEYNLGDGGSKLGNGELPRGVGHAKLPGGEEKAMDERMLEFTSLPATRQARAQAYEQAIAEQDDVASATASPAKQVTIAEPDMAWRRRPVRSSGKRCPGGRA